MVSTTYICEETYPRWEYITAVNAIMFLQEKSSLLPFSNNNLHWASL